MNKLILLILVLFASFSYGQYNEAAILEQVAITKANAGWEPEQPYDFLTDTYASYVGRILYVAHDGLATNDGLTEATPIDIYTAFNASLTDAGDVYWIKTSGEYLFDGHGLAGVFGEHLSLTNHFNASKETPISWIGYKNFVGDLDRAVGTGATITHDDYNSYPVNVDGTHDLDPTVMPTFSGNKDTVENRYLDNEILIASDGGEAGYIVKNLAMQYFAQGMSLRNISNIYISNVVTVNMGWFRDIPGQGGSNVDLEGRGIFIYQNGQNNVITDCAAFTIAHTAYSLGSSMFGVIRYTWADSLIDNKNPQDYYYHTTGRNNWFHHLYAGRLVTSGHSGHGICSNQLSFGIVAEHFVVEGTSLHMDGGSHGYFANGTLIGRPDFPFRTGLLNFYGGSILNFDGMYNALYENITGINVSNVTEGNDQDRNSTVNPNAPFPAAANGVMIRNYKGTGQTSFGLDSPIMLIGHDFSPTRLTLDVVDFRFENSEFEGFSEIAEVTSINSGLTFTNVNMKDVPAVEKRNESFILNQASSFTDVNFQNSEVPIGFNQINTTTNDFSTVGATGNEGGDPPVVEPPVINPPVITGNSNLFFKGKPVGENGLIQVRTRYFKGKLISLNQSNMVDDVPDVPDTSTAIRFFDNPNLPFLQANEPTLPTFTPTSVADLEDSANANKIAIISNSFNVDGADFVEGLYLRPAGGAITGFNFNLNGAIIVSNGQQIFDKDVTFLGIYTDSALTPEMFLPSTTTDWMPAFEAGLLNCSDFYLDGGDYDIRSRTIFNASIEKDFNLYGNGSRLLFDTGTSDENFVFNVDKVNWGINNLEVDGQNLSNKAFIFDLGNVDIDNVNIHDFLSDAGIQAFGIQVNFDSTLSDYVTITNSTFGDIEATDDENAAANSNSISRAINVRYVDREGSGTILIEDNLIENIFGVDADGIFLNTTSFAEEDKAYDHDIFMEINRNTIKRCSRRAVKIQGSNVVVNDNDIEVIDFNDPKANSSAVGVGFQDIGITFPQTIKNRTLTNNRFTSVGDSEVPFFAASGIEGLIVSGNSFIKPQPDNRGGVQIGGQVNLGTGFAINSQIFDNTFVNCGIQVATMVAVDHPDSGVFIHDNEFTFEVNNTLNGVINLRLGASAIEDLYFTNNIVNMNYNTSNGNFGGVINSRLSSMRIESLTMENNDFNFAGTSVLNEKFARIEGDVLNTNIIRNNRINGITTSGAFEINGTVGFENLNNLDENDNSITCINGDCTSIIDLTQVIGKEN